jgi:hypothetical protein
MLKKIRTMITSATLGFLLMPSVLTAASTGGKTSTQSFFGGSHFYTGKRVFFFFLPGHEVSGSILTLLLLVIFGFIFWKWLKRKRYQRAHPESVVKITPELDADFRELFVRVQEDMSTNNQDDLSQVLGSGLLQKQIAALNKYADKHIYARIADVNIIELEEEQTLSDDSIHVMVTAEMRQYLEYTDKDEAFNKQMRDLAKPKRSYAVWEMHREHTGQLIVDKIRSL